MRRGIKGYLAVLTVLLLLVSPAALAGSFIDTQITFTFSDGNVFETSSRSTAPGLIQIDDELFNENLNTEKKGDETETHLVLYKKIDGFIPRLITEAALVLQFSTFFSETGDLDSKLMDDGSYLKVTYMINKKKNHRISLTGFPFDSQRFLLGYTYDLTWGGESTWPKGKINKINPVPGMRITYSVNNFAFFVGFKARPLWVLNERNEDSLATQYGLLTGASYDILKMVKVSVNGGVFQKGTNLKDGVKGEQITASGISAQVFYRYKYPIKEAGDLTLYKNDPRTNLQPLAKKVEYPGGIGFLVGGEFTYLVQNLQDPDSLQSSKLFNAFAANFKLRFKYNRLRVNFDYVYRNLEFLLFSVPGMDPYMSFPDSAITSAEQFFSLGADYNFKGTHLTIGLMMGYKIPATYKGAANVPTTVVVKDREDFSAFTSGFSKNKVTLPAGATGRDILAFKFLVRYQISKLLTAQAEMTYLVDRNETRVADDGSIRFQEKSFTDKLGFAFILQARF